MAVLVVLEHFEESKQTVLTYDGNILMLKKTGRFGKK